MKINNFIYMMLMLLLSFSFISCDDDKNDTVDIRMSNILLQAPGNDAVIDLGNNDLESYTFRWQSEENPASEYTIILSKSVYLTHPIYIDVEEGNSSYAMSVDEIDKLLVSFGLKDGESEVIYWSVKPTKGLGMAASYVNSFTGIRKKKRLLLPADMSTIAIDGNNMATVCLFSWDKEELDETVDYAIHFNTKEDMSGKTEILNVSKSNSINLTHGQLQAVLNKLEFKKYSTDKVYWNIINTQTGVAIENKSSLLYITGSMTFTDVRGSETIEYKVTRIQYSDGSTKVWLAENLRATKYPDGNDIGADVLFAPAEIGADRVKVYGGYYAPSIKMNIAPTGWALPTIAEYEKLFHEASLVDGKYNVLKDPVYYSAGIDQSLGNANAWGLGLVSAGMFEWEFGNFVNNNSIYCYFHAADTNASACLLHDGGPDLWTPWPKGAIARFVLIE